MHLLLLGCNVYLRLHVGVSVCRIAFSNTRLHGPCHKFDSTLSTHCMLQCQEDNCSGSRLNAMNIV